MKYRLLTGLLITLAVYVVMISLTWNTWASGFEDYCVWDDYGNGTQYLEYCLSNNYGIIQCHNSAEELARCEELEK